ncbi:IS66 family insertion sequence element accessory protein TnpA [Methylomonas sp. CM2]|uniref:IS66 family insertion sequence element accessory protein TnpA n=1 Tax=Methylomonas sp. CM2 TaxID=3417647 RepID=UPI003CF0B41E
MTESPLSEATLTIAQRRWLEHFKQQHSGLSMAAYARQQGLAISTFYAMSQRLSAWAASGAWPQRPLFQAVALVEAKPLASGPLTLAFDLPGDLRCQVGADVATGAALLQALARQAS